MQNDISESLSAKEIFTRALELPDGPAREAWLREQCKDDAALRQKIEELLAASGQHTGASPLDVMVDAFAPGETLLTSDQEEHAEPSTKTMPERLERRQIGPYKLLEQIGQGGFGTVYMAEQTVPVRRKVALKILKPGMDSGELIARFEAERQALAMMDHPNIARIYDGGTTDQGLADQNRRLPKGRFHSLTRGCQPFAGGIKDEGLTTMRSLEFEFNSRRTIRLQEFFKSIQNFRRVHLRNQTAGDLRDGSRRNNRLRTFALISSRDTVNVAGWSSGPAHQS